METETLKWLIDAAKDSYDTNIYKAKSWLLTGATMFPDDISIKMESYKLTKLSKAAAEAAKELSSMLKTANAVHNEELQAEVKSLLNSVQNGPVTPEDKLNSDIFSAIPEEQQSEILIDLSTRSSGALSKCSVLLLLVKRFPWQSKEYGNLLIETLFEAELKETPNIINNIYRRYFVTDALPLMLKENPSGTDKKILINWLDKALQYYIVMSFQPPKEGMLSPTHGPLHLKKQQISRPWESMAELLSLTAKQVKWNITHNHYTDNNSLMQYLVSLKQRYSKEHSKSLKKELVYNSLYLWSKLVHSYNSLTRKTDTVRLIQQTFTSKPALKQY